MKVCYLPPGQLWGLLGHKLLPAAMPYCDASHSPPSGSLCEEFNERNQCSDVSLSLQCRGGKQTAFSIAGRLRRLVAGIAKAQETSAGGAVKLGESISMPMRSSLASAKQAQRSTGLPMVGTCTPFICRILSTSAMCESAGCIGTNNGMRCTCPG